MGRAGSVLRGRRAVDLGDHRRSWPGPERCWPGEGSPHGEVGPGAGEGITSTSCDEHKNACSALPARRSVLWFVTFSKTPSERNQRNPQSASAKSCGGGADLAEEPALRPRGTYGGVILRVHVFIYLSILLEGRIICFPSDARGLLGPFARLPSAPEPCVSTAGCICLTGREKSLYTVIEDFSP